MYSVIRREYQIRPDFTPKRTSIPKKVKVLGVLGVVTVVLEVGKEFTESKGLLFVLKDHVSCLGTERRESDTSFSCFIVSN